MWFAPGMQAWAGQKLMQSLLRLRVQEDESVRKNRLALMNAVASLPTGIIDLSALRWVLTHLLGGRGSNLVFIPLSKASRVEGDMLYQRTIEKRIFKSFHVSIVRYLFAARSPHANRCSPHKIRVKKCEWPMRMWTCAEKVIDTLGDRILMKDVSNERFPDTVHTKARSGSCS